jgi:uncharacterized protein (DUF58 family)
MPGTRSERLRYWAADWARRRQGDDGNTVTLKRRRIYILPTRYGVVFGAMVLAMLLGSLNYGASLGFALTFLLTGLGLVTMQYCHNNLLAAEVSFAGADPVFAGEEARFAISLTNATSQPRFDIAGECAGSHDGPVDIAPGATAMLHLHLPTTTRGWVRLSRFSISTRHPANLFRAWTWVHMDARCLVYPQPAPAGRPLPSGTDAYGTRSAVNREEDDFVGLRDAAPGDPPRRLAWKAFARSGQLMVKEFAGGAERPCLFEWKDLPELDDEQKLSQLARWCLDASAGRLSFGLVLPDQKIPLGNGDRHLHDCLQALALHGIPA